MKRPKHKPYSLRDRLLWLSLGLFLGVNFWAYALSPIAQAGPSWNYSGSELPKVVIPPPIRVIPDDPVYGKPIKLSSSDCGYVDVFEAPDARNPKKQVYTWKKPECSFGGSKDKLRFALLSDSDKDEMRDVRARRLCRQLGSTTFVDYKAEPENHPWDVLEIEESGQIRKRNYENEKKKPLKYELFEYVQCN